MNRLLFGDNFKWLRDTKIFPDASVDLVYLNPPFNSNADFLSFASRMFQIR
jgi:16S rRNA G966 N2-methylase RsmD